MNSKLNKTLLVTLFGILSMGYSFSQKGNVTINKDPRIDNLIQQEGAIAPGAAAPQMQGYRLQIFFDSKKELVDQARNRFIASNPKIDTYVTYNAPNYYLKVGDFRTYSEAEKVKSNLDNSFNTSFIVQEKINLPRID